MGKRGKGNTRSDDLQALYALCSLISSAEPMESVLNTALERISTATDMPAVCIELLGETTGAVERRYARGTEDPAAIRSLPAFSEFPLMAGSRRGGTLLLASPENDPLDPALHPWASSAAAILGCFVESRMGAEALRASRDRERTLISEVNNSRQEFEEIRKSHPGLDLLTLLPNSALFRFLLGQAVARARRGKHTLAVLHIDLDHYRDLCATLGNENGEKLIRQIADRLKRNCREGDNVARAGEDDFLWVVSNVPHLEDIAVVAEKALEVVSRPIPLENKEHSITASVGISVFPYDGGDSETMLKFAETALMRAKDLGRNRYQFYTEELNTKVQEQLVFKRRLRDAMDRGEFILHYQPVLKTASGTVESVEALIRWQKPEGNLSYPGEFMPASESAGLTARLDEWVIAAACEQVRRWSDAHGSPLRVTVNISSSLFEDQALHWKISSIVKEAGIRPDQLELDISQRVLMADIEVAGAILKRLKQSGVRVSIDDFGHGMLDLDSLREFPVDSIKIDPAFVRDIHINPYTSAVTAGILSLAKSLKIHAVAKGVENEEQLNYLKSLQCDAFQGNLRGAAIASGEIPAFLEQNRVLIVSQKVQEPFEPAPDIELETTASVQSQWMETTAESRAAAPASAGPMYLITCFHCGAIFNAVEAPWCDCIVTENTLTCPQCGKCFCAAPVAFKMDFWSDAPQTMWERRIKLDTDEEPLPPNPSPEEARRPIVLIIDDERPILVSATKAIRNLGLTALHASGGDQGLEMTRKYTPDLVITDALMPKLDGREMCKLIKMDSRLSRVKVVIVTSLSADARERNSAIREYKADDYIQKPLTRPQLDDILRRFTGK